MQLLSFYAWIAFYLVTLTSTRMGCRVTARRFDCTWHFFSSFRAPFPEDPPNDEGGDQPEERDAECDGNPYLDPVVP